jgi:hypothetical protein
MAGFFSHGMVSEITDFEGFAIRGEGENLRYSLPVAYALWAISGFGALGLQRFYLGKVGTGFIWLFSGGLAGIGGIYDLFTLPKQVQDANMRTDIQVALEMGSLSNLGYEPKQAGFKRIESVEKIILRLARKNSGMVSAGEVAIEADVSVEEAQKELDKLAKKGMAEIRVRSSGVIVYFFPEFSSENSDFVDL